MSSSVVNAVPVPDGSGNGTVVSVDELRHAAVQIHVASGSAQLQGTIDSNNWVDVGAPVTADGFIPLPHYMKLIRVVSTTVAGGTASVGGLIDRG